MKFSSRPTFFPEKSHNVGWLIPFFLYSLGLATIFTFFLLFSSTPFKILPKQGLENLHAQQQQQNLHDHKHFLRRKKHPNDDDDRRRKDKHILNQGIKKEEEEVCDLFKGKWIREMRREEMYTNSSCKTIPDSKNCFRHGRMDTDFLHWRWKPDECELPRFSPKIFLERFRGKKVGFVGDSVARNHIESLLCLLSQEENPKDIYKDPEDRFREWHFPNHNLTLKMLWSQYLIAAKERIINGMGTSIFDLQLDKIDERWTQHLPELDYAVISDGHWFFRVLYLHWGNNLIGCVYCNKPNITNKDIRFAFQTAFRTTFKYINSCKNCGKLVTLFRTFSPAHFENGSWNTGGSCNRTGPRGEGEIDMGRFDWEIRKIQMEEVERAKREGRMRGKRYGIVDVTRAMLMREDGHPGAFWGNQWMKGYNDCVHWCMPGPIDVWNDFLMAVLMNEAGI